MCLGCMPRFGVNIVTSALVQNICSTNSKVEVAWRRNYFLFRIHCNLMRFITVTVLLTLARISAQIFRVSFHMICKFPISGNVVFNVFLRSCDAALQQTVFLFVIHCNYCWQERHLSSYAHCDKGVTQVGFCVVATWKLPHVSKLQIPFLKYRRQIKPLKVNCCSV
jgi:hypothetical protein